jgi:hypothetical protein
MRVRLVQATIYGNDQNSHAQHKTVFVEMEDLTLPALNVDSLFWVYNSESF